MNQLIVRSSVRRSVIQSDMEAVEFHIRRKDLPSAKQPSYSLQIPDTYHAFSYISNYRVAQKG